MSFDVFLQRFRHGDAAVGGREAMRAVLEPHITREDPETSFVHVVLGDGSVDIHLSDGGMLANHVAGRQPWDLLAEGARAAGWTILPVGCPALITEESHRPHLPVDLAEQALLVVTGADILRAINEA